MQRLSYPTETVLSNKITTNRIVPSFKDSPRTPLRRRPNIPPTSQEKTSSRKGLAKQTFRKSVLDNLFTEHMRHDAGDPKVIQEEW